jgi:hypothetical protein
MSSMPAAICASGRLENCGGGYRGNRAGTLNRAGLRTWVADGVVQRGSLLLVGLTDSQDVTATVDVLGEETSGAKVCGRLGHRDLRRSRRDLRQLCLKLADLVLAPER